MDVWLWAIQKEKLSRTIDQPSHHQMPLKSSKFVLV